MWQQILSKVPITQRLDLSACDIEHRPSIQVPISFESALKNDSMIQDLSRKSVHQLNELRHCIPGQFTKSDHLRAAYYDMPVIDSTLDRWIGLSEIQAECTARWIQSKMQNARSKPNWSDEIWHNVLNERNNSNQWGVCDTKHWFKFVDTLNIGPYITHPWGPELTALITNEIIKYLHKNGHISHTVPLHILDVGCGVGEFGGKLNEIIDANLTKISLDGIDRSMDSLKRLQMNDVYHATMEIDLCRTDQMQGMKEKIKSESDLYDIIVSTDCLQISYGNDYSPGAKAVQDLMELVKPNGYYLIVCTLQSPATYKVSCIFDDILKDKWNQNGFECIADLTVRGFGDFKVEYNDEHERHSVENNISFVKLMQRVA